MEENTVPVIKLQETNVTLDELAAQYQGQAIGFQIPYLDSVLLFLSSEEYSFVTSTIWAKKSLPIRPSRTPEEYFAETVHILKKLEQKHDMSSAEFYRRFQEGTLQEGPTDYWEWRVRYKSLLTMKERFSFSETDIADA